MEGLKTAGFEPVVLAPIDENADILAARGVRVYSLPIARSGMNPLTDLALLLRYFRLLREIKPAAYCGFTIKPNVYGAIAARAAGVPAINNVTGLASPFLSQGLVWAIADKLYRFAFRRSFRVFFHNQDDRDFCVGQGIVRDSQARVIPGSGVDLKRFSPVEPHGSNAGRSLTFLFVGRLILHKGIREFVEAARMVKARSPDTRFQILGNPDPGNPTSVSADELAGWVREDVIEHLGEHDDVRPFVAEADCIVLPSYREGMPRTLLEAGAMAKPAIAADVPGCRQAIEDGVTGLLCEARSAVGLAQAISKAVDMERPELQAMGRRGRERIERGFSESKVVDAYIEALAELGLAPTP